MNIQRFVGLIVLGGVFFALAITDVSGADSEKTWLESSLGYKEFYNVTLKNGEQTPTEYINSTATCKNYEVKTANALSKLATPWLSNASNSKTLCMHEVDGGLAGGGYFLANGTSIAGKLEGPSNSLYAIKDSPHMLSLESGGYASNKLKIIPNAYRGMEVSRNLATGSVTYKIQSKTSDYIREGSDSSSSPLIIKTSTLKFSENGEWAVADTSAGYFVRLNMHTGTATIFGGKLNYNDGQNPFSNNAISNDGRFVAVASYMQTFFRVYDLSVCTNGPVGSPHIKSCLSRDLKQVMESRITNFAGGAHNISIVGGTVYFYATYNVIPNVERSIGRFAIAPDESMIKPLSKIDYLALGDSFASGQGTFYYKPFTDTNSNKCHTSTVSYPYLISKVLSNVASVESIACSGAKMKDVMIEDLISYNKNDPQAKGKEDASFNDEITRDFLPGYRAQLTFVKDKKPNITTMSMAGNDIGFSDIIQSCVLSQESCYHYYEDRAEIVHSINSKYNDLVSMYEKIKASANNGAKVYIVGYPKFAKPDGKCAVNVKMNREELEFGIDLVDYLNSVIEKASTQAGVAYVDVEEAFAGYKLCENSRETVAMNGIILDPSMAWLSAGLLPDSYPVKQMWYKGLKPPLAESYHPNKIGHQMYKDAIIKATNGFTQSMPESVVSNPSSTPLSQISFVSKAPKANRTILPVKYEDSLTIDAVLADSQIPLQVNQSQALKPNSAFSVYGYSEPTLLGEVTTDENGEIGDAQDLVDLDGKLKPGYHTIHLRATNVLDEPVELTKIIFVAHSAEDLNGDGVNNQDQPCLGLMDASGIDDDGDGIDDACDIVEPAEASDGSQETTTETGEAEEPPTEGPIDVIEPDTETKELPISESRPEWLLQLESELEAKAKADQQNLIVRTSSESTLTSTGQPQTATAPHQNNTVDQSVATEPDQTPKKDSPQPITDVQGASSSATDSLDQTTQSTKTTWPYLLSLITLCATAILAVFIRRISSD